MCPLKIITVLVLSIFGVVLGDISYDCKPATTDLKVNIIIDRARSNFGNGTLLLKKNTGCKGPVLDAQNTTYSLTECPADTAIDVEWVNVGKDNVVFKTELYSLNCSWNGKDAYVSPAGQLTVDEELGNSGLTKTEKDQNVLWTEPGLIMTVAPESGKIGDNATITITSSGTKNGYLVEQCTASATNNAHYNHTLYNNCATEDKDLFPKGAWINSTDTKNVILTHDMKYFRFKDSFEIKLECKVKICYSRQNTQCSSCAAVARRRRRSVDGKRALVRATFKVVDENVQTFSAFNSASGLTTNGIQSIVTSACTCIVIGLQRLTLN